MRQSGRGGAQLSSASKLYGSTEPGLLSGRMSPALAHTFTSSHSLGGLLNRVNLGSNSNGSHAGGAQGHWSGEPYKLDVKGRAEVASGLTVSANGSDESLNVSAFPLASPKAVKYSPYHIPQPPSLPPPAVNIEFPPPLEPRSYTVLKEVGDGSFGTVWLADWHSSLHVPVGTLPPGPSSRPEYKGKQLVAIKRMKKAFEGGWDECMKLKELKIPMHPNIIPLYDAFLLASTKELYFVFECMEGNLYQLTKSRKGRPLAAGLTGSIFRQILEGLDHIHNYGYFHRDMKPENLLITTTGLADYPASSLFAPPNAPPEKDVLVTVKLADFGLARETNSRPPYTEYVSTRWYRAPEVLLRARDYSNPVDMWALGTIMVETITLKPLFPGESEIDQVFKICEQLGDPSPEYGFDEHGQVNGGGPWQKGAALARGVGFSFPKMPPKPLASLFDSSTVPSQLVHCLSSLLRFEPRARLTARQCLDHSYFRDIAPHFAPPSSVRTNGYHLSHSASTADLVINPSSISSRTLPPSHSNGTPAYLKPAFQLPSPSSPHLEDQYVSRDPLLRHQSVDSTVSGMSGYGMQVMPPREDGYDSPMSSAFPENVQDGAEYSSLAPGTVWNGQPSDPSWGRSPSVYHQEQHLQPPIQHTQYHQGRRAAVPAFGTLGRRGSFSSSIAPSLAASTFYDGSIFEGIAPVRAASIMSFPAMAYQRQQGNGSDTSFPNSPVMQRESSQESMAPSVATTQSQAPTKGRSWAFFGGDKAPTPTAATSIVQRHAQAQAQAQAAQQQQQQQAIQQHQQQPQNANPLKRTPSNPSTSRGSYDEQGAKTQLDPKKAKKEAEKLAKEAEKLKREMLQQASRERARAVMKKKNQLMEAADPLHNFSNHTRVAGPDKGKARADRSASGVPSSSKASIMSGKTMPQIAEDSSRLSVNDNRYKMRRRDDDESVHSASSNETGHSSQRGRAFSISSHATSASDPQPRPVQYSDNSVHRIPSLSALPSPHPPSLPQQSSHYYPPPPNTGHSSLDHQLIKNMQGLSANDGYRSPGGSRSTSPRDSAALEARYSPYPLHPSRLSSGHGPQGFDPSLGHMRQASQATGSSAASIQSFHSTPSALPSHFGIGSKDGSVPKLPYLPTMDAKGAPSPGTTFPYTQSPDSHQHR